MGVDESSRDIQSDIMHDIMEEVSIDQHEAINRVLVCVCGWGYEALKERSEQ